MNIKKDLKDKIMKMKPSERPMIYRDHKLKTRRDFLSQGFLSSAAFTLGPSLMTLLKTDIATAADGCVVEDVSETKTPVLIIDLAGGANFAGNNFLVGGPDGQHDYLDSYGVMGLTDELNPKNNSSLVNRSFGIKMHANSGVLEGMLDFTQGNPGLRNRVDGAFFCAQTENDQSGNPLSPVYWLAKAGALGDLSATGGSEGSLSGGYSDPPVASLDPTVSPIQIRTPQDIVGMIDMGMVQTEFGSTGIDKAQKILKRIEYMSAHKIQSFTNKSLSEQLKQVAECGFDTTRYTEGTLNVSAIDPRQDSVINNVYGNENDEKEASIVKSVVDGLVGVGSLQMGGYDYHGNTRLEQDDKDYRVGRAIGRALSVAAAKQKDLMIILVSDGGVVANGELQAGRNGVMKYRFEGDNSARAGAVMLTYRHSARNRRDILRTGTNNLETAKRMVGSFKNGPTPAVNREDGSLIQSTAQNFNGNLAAVFVANYLAFNGEEERFLDIVGDSYQSIQDDLERYLVFRAAPVTTPTVEEF